MEDEASDSAASSIVFSDVDDVDSVSAVSSAGRDGNRADSYSESGDDEGGDLPRPFVARSQGDAREGDINGAQAISRQSRSRSNSAASSIDFEEEPGSPLQRHRSRSGSAASSISFEEDRVRRSRSRSGSSASSIAFEREESSEPGHRSRSGSAASSIAFAQEGQRSRSGSAASSISVTSAQRRAPPVAPAQSVFTRPPPPPTSAYLSLDSVPRSALHYFQAAAQAAQTEATHRGEKFATRLQYRHDSQQKAASTPQRQGRKKRRISFTNTSGPIEEQPHPWLSGKVRKTALQHADDSHRIKWEQCLTDISGTDTVLQEAIRWKSRAAGGEGGG